jgi:hypothetical protein
VSPHRWDFISGNRADFGVKRICRVLGVSRAGYYRHLATEQAHTERRRRQMTETAVESESAEQSSSAVNDEQLIAMLVDRARSEGLQLTGEGGSGCRCGSTSHRLPCTSSSGNSPPRPLPTAVRRRTCWTDHRIVPEY